MPQALLEPDPVVADRRREDDVGEPLDPPAERPRPRRCRPACQASIMSTCSRVITAPNPISAPVAPSMNDSRMKLSLPVRRVIGRGSSLDEASRVDEPAGVERRLLDRDDALDRRPSPERVRLEVDAGQRGLELEQDQRQPDVGDRLVVRDRDPRVERLAEVGRDREDEQRVGAGAP